MGEFLSLIWLKASIVGLLPYAALIWVALFPVRRAHRKAGILMGIGASLLILNRCVSPFLMGTRLFYAFDYQPFVAAFAILSTVWFWCGWCLVLWSIVVLSKKIDASRDPEPDS